MMIFVIACVVLNAGGVWGWCSGRFRGQVKLIAFGIAECGEANLHQFSLLAASRCLSQ